MAETPITTPGSGKARSSSVTNAVLLDMADTTWRLFIPTVGLLLVGRHFDLKFGTKPWLMLVGVGVGALVAAVLIRRQMKPEDQESGGAIK
ncbi:AtpZ/AtpI family protein [Candidatus Saccharibacteria bacterium]|nr:MAG: AtpZ/AtpI family protein [Candidatus Saccharibacteria bacterium]